MNSGEAIAKPPFDRLRTEWCAARLAFAVMVVIAGCAESQLPTVATADRDVTLKRADAAELQRVLESHRGKIVVVDFWATWCGPCVEQFPHTVEMAAKYRDRDVVVVSVSMDNPTSESQVRAFLEKQGARFDNLLSSYGSPVEATKAFGLPGPVPCYRIYDRNGELIKQFAVNPRAERQFTTADVDAALEAAL